MFNNRITVEEFLKDYWQQKPLLFRNAFPDIRSPLSADELAGLACEENSNARLIIETENKPNWQVEYGPFTENRFSELPETNWTLLVSDVEKHVPEGFDLLEHFRFIPDWRVDDLMISYAVEGGSVGPHMDAYDVFLLQLEGKRHWSLRQSDEQNSEDIIEDIELRILKNFSAEKSWLLNPGDMLYLPPEVAHLGVAEDECLTCSIGFRAPSIKALISSFAEFTASNLPQSLLYSDTHLKKQDHPGEITLETLSIVKQLIIENLIINDQLVQKWFGQFMTELNTDCQALTRASTNDKAITLSVLDDVETVTRSLSSKFLFSRMDNQTLLFVNGTTYKTSSSFAQTICESHVIKCSQLKNNIHCDDDKNALLDLIAADALYVEQ